MKIAVCFSKKPGAWKPAIVKMAKSMCLEPEHKSHTIYLENGAVSYIPTGDRFSSIPFFYKGVNGNFLLISGVPISHDGPIEPALQSIVNQNLKDAVRILSRLEGAFAIIYWDQATKRLALVTDFLGMQPMYIAKNENYFILASELKAIGCSGLVEIKSSAPAWGQFVSFGHLLANHTCLKNVNRVSPASIMVYDTTGHKTESEIYWQWPDRERITSIEKVNTSNLVNLISKDIHGYNTYCQNGALLLSGGFDSRIVLGMLLREKIDIEKGIILKHRDENNNADGRFAVKVARLCNFRFEVKESHRDFYSSRNYLSYLIMTDVATSSLYLFIAQLMGNIDSSVKAIWESVYPGCFLVTLHQPSGGFQEYMKHESASKDSKEWRGASRVFSNRFSSEMYDGFLFSNSEEMKKYTDDGYGVSRFIISNRTRNRTAINPLQVYANRVLPFTPGLNRRLCGIITNIDHKIRTDHNMYIKIYNEHFPELLKMPFTSGSKIKNYNPIFEISKIMNPIRSIVGWRLSTKLGLRFVWEKSKFVQKVLDKIELDHEELNADEILKIRQASTNESAEIRTARHYAFYWQMWRWLMEDHIEKEIGINLR